MAIYKQLKETSISRFVQKHAKDGYVIVSSNRSENDKATNNKLDKELKKLITNAGWSFTPIYGGYVETNEKTKEKTSVYEQSFIIYNHNRKMPLKFEDLKTFALEVCKKYKQECVLICPPDEAPYYCDEDGEQSTTFDKNMSIRDLTQEYFSTLSRSKRNTKRGQFSFKFVECCLQLPSTIMGRHNRELVGEAIPRLYELED